ncbi:hypothetical protein J1605_018358 [Eschrichtius robustus]|uniref:P-type ATPase N-terminal domain-containing protein n=1 Tax=Eschrichtius robustus TaxID=9764 RepID=A0AB34HW60_ESCRO|nr:hypothetical protein J1605_018358 [Eschrichtius robustus]
MTEPLQWAGYHWQRLTGGANRDDHERPYSYSSLLACRGKPSQTPTLAGKHRVVVPHLQPFKDEYEKFSGTYVNNRIRTTKYTLLNFVPRNLFEQFHRVANLYFLFLVVLNWVPLVEAFQKEITMLPLVAVLTIIAIKDGLEDYRKYKLDKQINNLVTKVYSRKEKKYVDRCWKDVTVGDFIRLSCNEVIPADMVLLFSTDPDGICHIETSGLDGESNLKQRQVVRGYTEQVLRFVQPLTGNADSPDKVLIPISLYVSIEIVKLGQIYFIQSDVDFYNEKMDSTVQCRALNITEDLGQIQYLFSDKTGTLTENKMVFRRCSVAGFDYCHEENEQKQEELQSCSLRNVNHIHRKVDKMKRQRTMPQMKEQDKTTEKQLNKVEIGTLPEKEFRIMIMKMIQDLGKRMEAKIEKMQEMFNKDLEELKNKQTRDEQHND